jgi:dolichol-phosphate mannosyltransferase
MPEERSVAVELPKTVEFPTVRLPFHVRARAGMVKPANWFQLLRFSLVGVSGYLLNLGVFALCVHAFAIDYRLASAIAFVVSVVNNFWWNRHWTFDAKHEHPIFQGTRFFVVSLLAYGFTYIVLVTLVSDAGLVKVVAQAIAVAAATPLSFLGQKLWSFKA